MNAQRTAALVLISAATGFIGVGIGYKLAEKQLVSEFEKRLDHEINLARRLYKTNHDTPEDMVKNLYGQAAIRVTTEIDEIPDGSEADELLKKYAGKSPEPTAYHKIRTSEVKSSKSEAEESVVARRVFEVDDERGEIYVISAEEHAANESGYEQVTWSFYSGDGVMTDIHEERIEDYGVYIGDKNLEDLFGQDSGDPNVVCIRNEIVMIDYEIVRSLGTYRQEVLNEEPTPGRPSQRMSRGS